jgi:hypothetical protein
MPPSLEGIACLYREQYQFEDVREAYPLIHSPQSLYIAINCQHADGNLQQHSNAKPSLYSRISQIVLFNLRRRIDDS